MCGRIVGGGLATPTGGRMFGATAGSPTGTETASSKTGTSGTSRVSTAGLTTPAIRTAGMGGGYTLCVNYMLELMQ